MHLCHEKAYTQKISEMEQEHQDQLQSAKRAHVDMYNELQVLKSRHETKLAEQKKSMQTIFQEKLLRTVTP